MARVCFTPKCAEASNGTPAPYVVIPPASDDAGQRLRTKEGVLIPQRIHAPRFVPGLKATHALYTYNGGRRARDLEKGKVYRVPDGEAAYLDLNYPGLIERLPDEELHQDTVGALLDEKHAALKEAEAVTGELMAAREQVDKQSYELTSARSETQKFKDENARLQEEIKRLKAGATKKADKAAAKPKDPPK